MLKLFILKLLEEIEKKNSWGKNELKELIYKTAFTFLPGED